jgi:hypothetical protein
MRGRVCNLLCNCFLALPEQSLLGRSPAELTTIFYCLIWVSHNLEGQVLLFISPRNRVAQLYPRAQGSLFFASNDSQGSCGGILTRLYTGMWPVQAIYSPFKSRVRVRVLLAADSQSTNSSGLWASLWDPWPDFILLFFFRLTITLFFFLRRPLWREKDIIYNWISIRGTSLIQPVDPAASRPPLVRSQQVDHRDGKLPCASLIRENVAT